MTAAILFFFVAVALLGIAAKNELSSDNGIVMKAEGDGGSGGGDSGGWDFSNDDLPF